MYKALLYVLGIKELRIKQESIILIYILNIKAKALKRIQN